MKPITLIALDIDGVLNSVAHFVRRGHRDFPTRDENYLSDFDPDACAVLQEVCQQTGAELVISSTWRILHPLQEIRSYLKRRGVTAKVIGATPDVSLHKVPDLEENRSQWELGLEIQLWLQTYIPPEQLSDVRLCVLDDDGDMGDVRGVWVKANNKVGLVRENIPAILDHLGRSLKDGAAAGGPGKVEWTYKIEEDWVWRDGQGPARW